MERGAQNHKQDNKKPTQGESFYDSSKQCTGIG